MHPDPNFKPEQKVRWYADHGGDEEPKSFPNINGRPVALMQKALDSFDKYMAENHPNGFANLAMSQDAFDAYWKAYIDSWNKAHENDYPEPAWHYGHKEPKSHPMGMTSQVNSQPARFFPSTTKYRTVATRLASRCIPRTARQPLPCLSRSNGTIKAPSSFTPHAQMGRF